MKAGNYCAAGSSNVADSKQDATQFIGTAASKIPLSALGDGTRVWVATLPISHSREYTYESMLPVSQGHYTVWQQKDILAQTCVNCRVLLRESLKGLLKGCLIS
jgi:hypothetical protein